MQARAERDARPDQDVFGEGRIVGAEALARHEFRDFGKEVEGRFGPGTAHAGHGVQQIDGNVAPLLEGFKDGSGTGLVAGQAFEGAVLDEVVGAGLVVDVELGDDVDDRLGPDGGTQAPARHGELLGEGVENDAACLHARNGGQRGAFPAVADVEIGLVQKD